MESLLELARSDDELEWDDATRTVRGVTTNEEVSLRRTTFTKRLDEVAVRGIIRDWVCSRWFKLPDMDVPKKRQLMVNLGLLTSWTNGL
ncbi:MAG: hypothetical protein QM757_12895 [Paludibaculum sp.]